MPRSHSRVKQIEDLVHREIALLLQNEFLDKRIGLVTVLGVELSPDLRHAKVFVSVYESDKQKDTLKILNNAASFFRAGLARRAKLRIIPNIRFVFDDILITEQRIASLL